MDALNTFLINHPFLSMFSLMGLAFAIIMISTAAKLQRQTKLLERIGFFIFSLSLFELIFLGFINPIFFHQGYMWKNYEVISQDQNLLWTVDAQYISGGEIGPPEPAYRLHLIDLNNGETLFREAIGLSYQFLNKHGNTLWIKMEDTVKALDYRSGKTKLTVNQNDLEKYRQDLAGKIYKFDFNDQSDLIQITTKDGSEISFNPFPEDTGPIQDSTDEIIDDQISQNQIKFSLSKESKQKILNTRDQPISELTFLKARFLQYDPASNSLFLLSSPSLDSEQYSIHRISINNGREIWQKNLQEFAAYNYFLNPDQEVTHAVIYQDKIIFNIGQLLYNINISDGQVNWHKYIK